MSSLDPETPLSTMFDLVIGMSRMLSTMGLRLDAIDKQVSGFLSDKEAMETNTNNISTMLSRVDELSIDVQTLIRRFPVSPKPAPEPETYSMKVEIRDDVSILESLSPVGLERDVKKVGHGFEDIQSVNWYNNGPPVRGDELRNRDCCLIFIFDTFEKEERARTNHDEMLNTFGLFNSTVKSRIYILEIVWYYEKGRRASGRSSNEKKEMELLVSKYFPHLRKVGTPHAKISNGKVLLFTSHLNDARMLHGSYHYIDNQPYELRAYHTKATVVYCNNCGHPDHYSHQCNSKRQCQKCSEPHDTWKCEKERKDYRCPNCGEKRHAAYEHECKFRATVKARDIARDWYHVLPPWATGSSSASNTVSLSPPSPNGASGSVSATSRATTTSKTNKASKTKAGTEEQAEAGRGNTATGAAKIDHYYKPSLPSSSNTPGEPSSSAEVGDGSEIRVSSEAVQDSEDSGDSGSHQGSDSEMSVDDQNSDCEMLDNDQDSASASSPPAQPSRSKRRSSKNNWKKWNKSKGAKRNEDEAAASTSTQVAKTRSRTLETPTNTRRSGLRSGKSAD